MCKIEQYDGYALHECNTCKNFVYIDDEHGEIIKLRCEECEMQIEAEADDLAYEEQERAFEQEQIDLIEYPIECPDCGYANYLKAEVIEKYGGLCKDCRPNEKELFE